MKRILTAALGILTIGALFSVSSCVKKDFDAPPDNSGYDPQLPVTHTIAQLQAMTPGLIDTDVVIAGIVVMDDKSGNYYKKIVIQDATGGIEILVDQYSLYNDYPVGRKIYVKCKGLFVGAYNNNPQLGYAPDATGNLTGIPTVLSSDYLVKANYPNTIVPDTLTLTDLASPNAAKQYLNKLVAIKNVEFITSQVGLPYAQLATLASVTERKIEDCDGKSMVMRNSGYAKFQPFLLPSGKGTLLAIYTRYRDIPQLYIRDTSDVQFSGKRCDGSEPSAYIINDGFESLNNWNVVSVTGDQKWAIAQYGNPKPCAAMSGFSGSNFANEDWLISKGINLTGNYNTITMTFESAAKYAGNPLELYISTDYSGSGAPGSATWVPLTAVYDQSGSFTFTNSGNIDLLSYKNKTVYVAFKYTSTTSAAKSWELDNFRIKGE
ncbi:DUF5689 domain-containing protein [Taibaiella koreensis]|uniref:DUF5689 domain-containing protein n=1 Tax=Taibaiella koreensis TaxID=1268548 RepID=UPI000E59DD83|nr:DUF5689 domain-containing protein [Taibaiella koreensis]